ncbi:MAG: SPASM domain-containing protein, partial [Cetobacterium sp.]
WCPNKLKEERQTTYVEMNRGTIHKLIADLNKINYSGVISFSRYNEPFYNLDRSKETFNLFKNGVPNAKLVTNTNGDFINKSYLADLTKIFSEITIMNYDSRPTMFDLEPDVVTDYGDCKVLLASPNFEINDRGGVLKEFSNIKRTEPCHEPNKFIAIDYNGYVMPCCNMRSDFHEEFNLGNINKDSILDIMNSPRRLKILSSIPLISPCENCIKKPGRHTRDLPGINF